MWKEDVCLREETKLGNRLQANRKNVRENYILNIFHIWLYYINVKVATTTGTTVCTGSCGWDGEIVSALLSFFKRAVSLLLFCILIPIDVYLSVWYFKWSIWLTIWCQIFCFRGTENNITAPFCSSTCYNFYIWLMFNSSMFLGHKHIDKSFFKPEKSSWH